MNLNELSIQSQDLVGSNVGFIVKSMKNPEREYFVGFKNPMTGSFVITRTDTNEEFLVKGDADRYEMSGDTVRLQELYAKEAELEAGLRDLNDKIVVMENELSDVSDSITEIIGQF